jgi:hypothetical protein
MYVQASAMQSTPAKGSSGMSKQQQKGAKTAPKLSRKRASDYF